MSEIVKIDKMYTPVFQVSRVLSSFGENFEHDNTVSHRDGNRDKIKSTQATVSRIVFMAL